MQLLMKEMSVFKTSGIFVVCVHHMQVCSVLIVQYESVTRDEGVCERKGGRENGEREGEGRYRECTKRKIMERKIGEPT